ncbi:MAG: hypothetical protein KAJ48_04780 [Elusimicrobiales bacterium]|nr:hypothetical protein [Elusimicrobiales bacterium]
MKKYNSWKNGKMVIGKTKKWKPVKFPIIKPDWDAMGVIKNASVKIRQN